MNTVYCVIEEYMRGEIMPTDPDAYDAWYVNKNEALQHAAMYEHGIIVTLKRTPDDDGWMLI